VKETQINREELTKVLSAAGRITDVEKIEDGPLLLTFETGQVAVMSDEYGVAVFDSRAAFDKLNKEAKEYAERKFNEAAKRASY
jgi:hypothetical protein